LCLFDDEVRAAIARPHIAQNLSLIYYIFDMTYSETNQVSVEAKLAAISADAMALMSWQRDCLRYHYCSNSCTIT
jgi:hypothetical protein